MFDLVIEGGEVATETGLVACSIGVREGKVAALLAPCSEAPARETIDATGRIVLPGLVDAHVHFREPGLTHKEDFGSETHGIQTCLSHASAAAEGKFYKAM
jgi:dihydroorotase